MLSLTLHGVRVMCTKCPDAIPSARALITSLLHAVTTKNCVAGTRIPQLSHGRRCASCRACSVAFADRRIGVRSLEWVELQALKVLPPCQPSSPSCAYCSKLTSCGCFLLFPWQLAGPLQVARSTWIGVCAPSFGSRR